MTKIYIYIIHTIHYADGPFSIYCSPLGPPAPCCPLVVLITPGGAAVFPSPGLMQAFLPPDSLPSFSQEGAPMQDNVFCGQLQRFQSKSMNERGLHSWNAENCHKKFPFLCKRSTSRSDWWTRGGLRRVLLPVRTPIQKGYWGYWELEQGRKPKT